MFKLMKEQPLSLSLFYYFGKSIVNFKKVEYFQQAIIALNFVIDICEDNYLCARAHFYLGLM